MCNFLQQFGQNNHLVLFQNGVILNNLLGIKSHPYDIPLQLENPYPMIFLCFFYYVIIKDIAKKT